MLSTTVDGHFLNSLQTKLTLRFGK